MERIFSRHIYSGRVISLRSDTVRAPTGREHVADVVAHPGGVVVVAEEGSSLLFVRQFRYPVAEDLLECVAGTLEPGEAPELAANRELEEEAGFRASHLVSLGAVYSAPGFCTELLHIFLAEGLTPSYRPQDEDEDVVLVRLAPDEALRLASAGKIRDAKTLAALLLYQKYREAHPKRVPPNLPQREAGAPPSRAPGLVEAAAVAGRQQGKPVDLVAFDVDGTLVENHSGKVVWQVLFEHFGCDVAWSKERYKAFREGKISYREWVDLDVGEWVARGATRDAMVEAIRTHLRLSPGARGVVHELKSRGYRLAVISGTLDIVLDVLFPDHPFDCVFTNKLFFGPNGLITSWEATPFDMDGKEQGLQTAAQTLGTTPARCAFVGDHINDIAALRLAGLPIAYDPKDEEVARHARVILPRGGLRGLLHLFP